MQGLRRTTLVRKYQILEAVRHLIATRGMDGVTINTIAEAVGLTEGAIYRHFKSKNQIYLLLIDDMERSLLQTVEKAQVPEAPALDNLKRILEAHLSETEGGQAVSSILITAAMFSDGVGLGPRLVAMWDRYLESIKVVLHQGILEGALRQDLNLHAAATTFFGLLQSVATFWALSSYEAPLAEHRDDMWSVFTRGTMANP